MSNTILFALICGAAGVVYGIITALWVNKQDAGNAKMQEISNAVKEGANAFMAREYKTVAIVAVILVGILAFVPALGMWAAVGFIIGTVGSALAMPSISLMTAVSCGLRASNSSTTRGRPPVMSLVLVVSRGILASTSPG